MPQLAIALAAAEAATAAFGTAAVIGSLTPGALAFAGASALGSVLFAPTQKVSGPKLADLKATQASYGSVLPYVEGHVRVAGVIAWQSNKRPIESTTSQGGKGGGGVETTTTTYVCDVLYILSENEAEALRRVWNAGDVCWTPDSTESALWSRLTFYSGAADQLPDPTYEAAVGVGNAPAYRGRASVFIQDMQLGNSGQLLPLSFEIGKAAMTVRAGSVISLWNFDTDGQAVSIHSADYPGGSNPGVYSSSVIDQSEQTPNTWVLAGHNHDEPSLAPGTGLFLPEYQTAASFSCSVFRQTSAAWTISGDFTIEFRINPSGHSWASSGLLRYLISALSGSNSDGDWYVVHTTSSGNVGVGFTFRAGGLNYGVASGTTDLGVGAVTEVSFEREGSVLRCYVNGVLAGTTTGVSTADIGGSYCTIGGRNDGGYLVPNDFGTGLYTGFRVTEGLARYGGANYTPGQSWTLDGSATNVAAYSDEPTLQEVVERQCLRGGLDLAYVDASALATRHVHGMGLTQFTSPRAAIEMLKVVHPFDFVESDRLYFRWRGDDPVATIPYEHLVVQSGPPLPITLANDSELPTFGTLKYSNLLDDYQDGSEGDDRLVSTGQSVTQVEVALALTPQEAKAAIDFQIMDAAASALQAGPFSLTRDYAHLEPTDPVIVTDAEGNPYRVRLKNKREAAGVLTFDGVADDPHILTSTAVTTTGGYTFSTSVAPPIDTQVELLDIPILRDEDDDAGIYGVAKPSATVATYPGAVLFKSADDVTFDAVASFDARGVFGAATTTLGAGPVGVFDEGNSLTVDMGEGQLSSVMREVLLAGAVNVLLCGSEILQFRDAVLISAGVYKLTGLLRGLQGTEWAIGTHAAAERVVLLDSALRRVSMATGEIGVARFWKAVTMGRTAASADSQAFTNSGVGKMPRAPINVRRAISGADAVITWDRRDRKQEAPITGTILLSEASESYEVDITVGGATTTYTTASATLNVAGGAASLVAGTQINVYQMSALVGRGYAGHLTL